MKNTNDSGSSLSRRPGSPTQPIHSSSGGATSSDDTRGAISAPKNSFEEDAYKRSNPDVVTRSNTFHTHRKLGLAYYYFANSTNTLI